MRISIFTPTNNPIYLETAYNQLKDQDFYEWVILGNGGISINDFPKQLLEDNRIKITFTETTGSVGSLKKMTCSYCTGDILLELDADDYLLPNAIEEVKKVFEDPEIIFAYSNCFYFMDEQYWFPPFGEESGWSWKPFMFNGKEYRETKAPPPHPSNCSTIHYQPDHLRAFRKTAYDAVGGHDETLQILDDQDLMCKLFIVGKFKHIDKCLYAYYVNLKNTFITRQDEIAVGVYNGKKLYLSSMVESWAKRENLKTIAISSEKDFSDYNEKFTVDEFLRYDLDKSSAGLISLFNNFVGIDDKEKFLRKVYNTLIPGGMFLGIFPNNKDGWNKESFNFVLDANDPNAKDIRFYNCLIDEIVNSNMSFVRVALVALKKDKFNNEIFRPHGKILI